MKEGDFKRPTSTIRHASGAFRPGADILELRVAPGIRRNEARNSGYMGVRPPDTSTRTPLSGFRSPFFSFRYKFSGFQCPFSSFPSPFPSCQSPFSSLCPILGWICRGYWFNFGQICHVFFIFVAPLFRVRSLNVF